LWTRLSKEKKFHEALYSNLGESKDFLNSLVQTLCGASNMPSLDKVKKKTEEEAKKVAEDMKKAGKKVAVDAKKAGAKVAEETKKEAKKVKGKM
jgi:hypothetical protein